MLWLGLLTYSIGIFILECLLFIFGLHMSYESGLALALLNAVMGFLLGTLAYWRRRPAEIWGLYGTVAWPIALIHILSIPVGKERIDPDSLQQIGQEAERLSIHERSSITVPISTIDVTPVIDRHPVLRSADTAARAAHEHVASTGAAPQDLTLN